MGNVNKKNFYPVVGTVAGDLYKNNKNLITALNNTGPVRSYKSGDFSQDELDGILKGLSRSYPGKTFSFKPPQGESNEV